MNGTCRYRYDTLAGGLVSLTWGVALLATGIVLLVRARRSGNPTAPIAERYRSPMTPSRSIVMPWDPTPWPSLR